MGLSALGIVFGDIGTSPLYTLKTVLGLTGGAPTPEFDNTPPYLVSVFLKAYCADGLGVTGLGLMVAILIE